MSARVATLAVAALLMLPAARACAEPAVLFPPETEGCYVGAEISAASRPIASLPCRWPPCGSSVAIPSLRWKRRRRAAPRAAD